jgi:hypothetical protein
MPAVMAIILYASLLWPNRIILFFLIIPMKMIVASLLIIAIDLFYCIIYFRTGFAPIPPVGACVGAFLIFRFEPAVEGFFLRLSKKQRRLKIRKEDEQRKKIDDILDKINRYGMRSLTRSEVKLLRKASKKLAGKRD